jgi:membrane-associated phospholipid phosphatase
MITLLRTARSAPLRWILLAGMVGALAAPLPARANILGHGQAQFVSGTGTALYLAAGIALPLAEDGPNGKNHALRALDSVGTSVLLSEGLAHLIREKRPDSNAHDSFPSTHATAAFAVAAVESQEHPGQAGYWYAAAALIADSRVALRRHFTRDVVAGAALGYAVSRWELSRPHGLILSPFINPDRGGFGLQGHLSL